MPILVQILPPSFRYVGKSEFFVKLFSFTALSAYKVFSSMSNMSYFKYLFWTVFEILWNKKSTGIVYQLFHMPGIDTDPDPAKCCGSEPIRIHNTAKQYRNVLWRVTVSAKIELEYNSVNMYCMHVYSQEPSGYRWWEKWACWVWGLVTNWSPSGRKYKKTFVLYPDGD